MSSAGSNALLAPIVVRHVRTREPSFTCYVSGDYSTAEAVSRGVRQATQAGFPLTHADFSGLDLRRADFRGLNAPFGDFRGCALAGADFTAAFLPGARFDNCGEKDWSDRSRNPSSCARVNFSRAILTDANLSHARMPSSGLGWRESDRCGLLRRGSLRRKL